MKEKFKEYVSKFDMNEMAINRKYYHSYRVMDLAKLIAKYAKLNEEDAKIAEVAGLLHDYGRFDQWTEYHTYRDFESIDHGDYAVTKLFHEGEIANFWPEIKDYDEIFDAIKYHNKYAIPETLSDHNSLLCKVIRDADKLDILYLFASGTVLEKNGNEEVSSKVKESFDKQTQVKIQDKQNENDTIVGALAYIYDLNFKYSFEHLKKQKIIDHLFELIENKEQLKPYFDTIKEYINTKIEESETC